MPCICLLVCGGGGGGVDCGGGGGGKEGVEDACFIPADGGGGKGLPTILGGRDPSVELCLLRAPVLLEAPGGAEGGPLLGGGGGVFRGIPGACHVFVPPELPLFELLKFATESDTLFLPTSLL